MTTLENFVSPALTRALGWTLLHSLWQGALVAAVLAGTLLLLRRQRAEVRYVASAGALGMVVALAGITFGLYFNSTRDKGILQNPGKFQAEMASPSALPSTETSVTIAEAGGARKAGAGATRNAEALTKMPLAKEAQPSAIYSITQSLIHSLNDYLPLLVVAWLMGLLAMSLRMLGGLLYVQRLRSYRVRPLSAAWQERLAALAARSGVRRPVALLESALVQVPLVVGHWRPVILLPLGTVAGLTPAYLEAILAHELAHVLRRDYLVNLLQTVAEVLFFYHPAVWFVASCVRTERENCCDDTATTLVGGDPLRLACALTALAEWSQSAVVPTAPRLALAAMGKRSALLNRVRRLVTRRPAAPTLAEDIMASALVLGGLGLLGGSVALAGPLQLPATQKPAAFDWQTGPAQTAPKSTSVADTTKRTAGANTTSTTTTKTVTVPDLPAVPEPPQEIRPEVVVKDGSDADDDHPDQERPRPKHKVRRLIVNGREMDSGAFPGQPGTVVITKDKKGRLTDLVVNGQHVETATGKSKLKIKGKKEKGEDQQVQVVEMAPPFAPEARAFVFQNNAGDFRRLERNPGQNFTYRFQMPELDKRQAERVYIERFNKNFNKSFNGNFDKNFNHNFRVMTPGNGPDLEALRAAVRALREASTVKNLSTEQRKRINIELEDVRARLRNAESEAASFHKLRNGGDMDDETRARQQELQERRQQIQERIRESQQELRDLEQDRAQADHDRTQADRDRERADRDRERADRDRARAERDRVRADRERDQNEALIDQLQKDGLIKDRDNFQLKLTAKSLTVNGKEQPAKTHQKYLKLFEAARGYKMSNSGAMVVSRNGSSSTYRDDTPRPPRPPRAPLAPLTAPTPPTPMAPMAPPAPPTPPQIDTESLRAELRKDGVIGAGDKDFQFQLNGSGLTVNGKKQSDELAQKYRKMTGHDNGKKFNVTISTQE